MEIEYKWDLDGADGRAALDAAEMLSPCVRGSHDLTMRSVYYDTERGLVSELGGGLRLRRENERSVCCLKLPVSEAGACAEREEFEVEAGDIREGLRLLPGAGASREVCERLAADGPAPACEVEFERRAFEVGVPRDSPAFSAELSVDEGTLRHEGRERAFREMELEYKEGDLEAFHRFARNVQDAARLKPQPLSKLARALAL